MTPKKPILVVMSAAKYLFALWAGILIYATLSVFFGAKGLSAYRQLEREQGRQEVNISNLILINNELDNTMNSLLYDKDALAVYAREQGYASQSERFIRIVGLGTAKGVRADPGNVVVIAQPQYTPEQIIRITALCIGIAILICLAIFDVLKFVKDR